MRVSSSIRYIIIQILVIGSILLWSCQHSTAQNYTKPGSNLIDFPLVPNYEIYAIQDQDMLPNGLLVSVGQARSDAGSSPVYVPMIMCTDGRGKVIWSKILVSNQVEPPQYPEQGVFTSVTCSQLNTEYGQTVVRNRIVATGFWNTGVQRRITAEVDLDGALGNVFTRAGIHNDIATWSDDVTTHPHFNLPTAHYSVLSSIRYYGTYLNLAKNDLMITRSGVALSDRFASPDCTLNNKQILVNDLCNRWYVCGSLANPRQDAELHSGLHSFTEDPITGQLIHDWTNKYVDAQTHSEIVYDETFDVMAPEYNAAGQIVALYIAGRTSKWLDQDPNHPQGDYNLVLMKISVAADCDMYPETHGGGILWYRVFDIDGNADRDDMPTGMVYNEATKMIVVVGTLSNPTETVIGFQAGFDYYGTPKYAYWLQAKSEDGWMGYTKPNSVVDANGEAQHHVIQTNPTIDPLIPAPYVFITGETNAGTTGQQVWERNSIVFSQPAHGALNDEEEGICVDLLEIAEVTGIHYHEEDCPMIKVGNEINESRIAAVIDVQPDEFTTCNCEQDVTFESTSWEIVCAGRNAYGSDGDKVSIPETGMDEYYATGWTDGIAEPFLNNLGFMCTRYNLDMAFVKSGGANLAPLRMRISTEVLNPLDPALNKFYNDCAFSYAVKVEGTGTARLRNHFFGGIRQELVNQIQLDPDKANFAFSVKGRNGVIVNLDNESDVRWAVEWGSTKAPNPGSSTPDHRYDSFEKWPVKFMKYAPSELRCMDQISDIIALPLDYYYDEEIASVGFTNADYSTGEPVCGSNSMYQTFSGVILRNRLIDGYFEEGQIIDLSIPDDEFPRKNVFYVNVMYAPETTESSYLMACGHLFDLDWNSNSYPLTRSKGLLSLFSRDLTHEWSRAYVYNGDASVRINDVSEVIQGDKRGHVVVGTVSTINSTEYTQQATSTDYTLVMMVDEYGDIVWQRIIDIGLDFSLDEAFSVKVSDVDNATIYIVGHAADEEFPAMPGVPTWPQRPRRSYILQMGTNGEIFGPDFIDRHAGMGEDVYGYYYGTSPSAVRDNGTYIVGESDANVYTNQNEYTGLANTLCGNKGAITQRFLPCPSEDVCNYAATKFKVLDHSLHFISVVDCVAEVHDAQPTFDITPEVTVLPTPTVITDCALPNDGKQFEWAIVCGSAPMLKSNEYANRKKAEESKTTPTVISISAVATSPTFLFAVAEVPSTEGIPSTQSVGVFDMLGLIVGSASVELTPGMIQVTLPPDLVNGRYSIRLDSTTRILILNVMFSQE